MFYFCVLRFKDLGARRSSKGKALTLFAVCQKRHLCQTFGSLLWHDAASEIVRLALCQLLLQINYFTIQLVAPFSSEYRQRGYDKFEHQLKYANRQAYTLVATVQNKYWFECGGPSCRRLS